MGSHMAFAAKQSLFCFGHATSGGGGETCGETWLLSTLPPIWFDHGVGIFSDHGCEVGILGPYLDHPADLVPVVGSVMLHQGHGVGLPCSVSWLCCGGFCATWSP